MLDRNLPSSPQDLSVISKDTPIVLAESDGRALALILPPLDDLAEIRGLRTTLFSLQEHVDQFSFREPFLDALKELKRKEGEFSASPTFFNRVANLAHGLGDTEEEARNLLRARDLTRDAFFTHRYSDNLIARGLDKDAESILLSVDLSSDLDANLRLAYFHVERNEIDKAELRISNALQIDPLDFSARLFDGGLHLAQRRYQEAIHSFRIAAESRETATLCTNMALAFLQLNLVEKSFRSLKKAVALDPFHLNANLILADLAFREGRNEEALPSLRYFIQFEQTNADVWSRLARACFHVGLIDETVKALKRQASLGENSAIWNNLGVCYQAQRDPERALKAFKQAISDDKTHGRDYFFAARNLIQMLPNNGFKWKEILKFTSSTVDDDQHGLCLRDDILSDVYVFHVVTLNNLRQHEEARLLAEDLLETSISANRLKVWLVSSLIAYYALYSDGQRSLQLIREYEGMVDNPEQTHDLERRAYFFNNAAFALAELNNVAEAEKYLSKITNHIHHAPYPTATLGLVHFRKGHADRGAELYREAMTLCNSESDKDRIRQKLNYELGRNLILQNRPSEARRILLRVVEAQSGELALLHGAQKLLNEIGPKQ